MNEFIPARHIHWEPGDRENCPVCKKEISTPDTCDQSCRRSVPHNQDGTLAHHTSPEKEEAHAEMKSACAPYIDQVVEVLDDISRSMKELNKALDELLACLEK